MIYCQSTDELIFPAGALVIAMTAGSRKLDTAAAAAGNAQQQQQGAQRFFVGHTSFVCCCALGGVDGSLLLATGQEGKQALIRLWDFHPQQQQQQDGAGSGGSSSTATCLAVLCGEWVAA